LAVKDQGFSLIKRIKGYLSKATEPCVNASAFYGHSALIEEHDDAAQTKEGMANAIRSKKFKIFKDMLNTFRLTL